MQWAASVASVFWGVWWTSLVRDIAESQIATITYLGRPIEKKWVLIFLVLWGAIYAIIFVRWLARIQSWRATVGLNLWFKHSRSIIIVVATLIVFLFLIPVKFNLDKDIVTYGYTIAILWPIAPFIVAVLPEERR